MKTDKLWYLGQSGEIRYVGLDGHISRKFAPDCAIDKSFVPYLVMVFCLTVDLSIFISLFQMISYDSTLLLAVQVAGFAFGFDVVPIYLGIHLRRVRDGLSRDRFLLWLALLVFVMACAANVILRIATIDQIAPDLSSSATDLLSTVKENVQDDAVSMTAVAMTVMGITIPLLTSLGSFFISYMSYNPLQIRLRRCEEYRDLLRDEERQILAIQSEYDADEDYAQRLRDCDDKKYAAMRDYHRALVLSYCDYVNQAMKEHFAEPAAISALTEQDCLRILERLNRELDAFCDSDDGDNRINPEETKPEFLHVPKGTVA